MNLFKKGLQAEDKLKAEFTKLGIQFENFGREATIKNESINRILNFDDSATASFVRYQPDLIAYNKEAFLAEVKAGTTIEKNCFENYLRIEEAGINIFVFFLFDDCFYYCKPSEIPFYTYPSKNGLMQHKKAGVLIPVVGHWCFPRQMSKEDQAKFKKIMHGSGTAFGHLSISEIKKLKKL